MAAILELLISNYESVVEPDWCPGCGDFGALRALEDEQPTYEDCEPALRNGPLVGRPLGLSKETFDELMGEFI